MGTIVTSGKAEKLVEYDLLVTSINFNSRAEKTDMAIQKVVKECEEFLRMLGEAGADISGVEAGETSVRRYDYHDDHYVSASRSIVFRTKYDLKFVDYLTKIIGESGFDTDLDFASSVSNLKEIKNELAKEATIQAKISAEGMAAAAGLTVKGLERMKIDDNKSHYGLDEFGDAFWDVEPPRSLAKSVSVGGDRYAELSAPQTHVEVTVYTEWNVE